MNRPKIFCQFTDRSSLEPVSGDRINEIRFYRALSTFADVYYNDQLIDWSSGTIGHPNELFEPSRDYDLYYIRANHDLLSRVRGPKITMAYPYDDEAYRSADAVVVTTNAWRELIRDYNSSSVAQEMLSKWFPPKIVAPANIVNIRQTIDPSFVALPDETTAFHWRASTYGARIFGFFGRVTEETIPDVLVRAVQRAQRAIGGVADPLVAFSGSVRSTLPPGTLNLGPVAYDQMPALLSASYGILGQECIDSSFLGSGKILDAMAVGVPILTRRNAVRDEQLGADYPGLFEVDDEAYSLVMQMCSDEAHRNQTMKYLKHRRELFLPEASGQQIQAEFNRAGLM